MPTIAVSGSTVQHHPAERGTVRLAITFTGDRRDHVFRAAEKLHGSVVAQAKEHVAAGAATWWGSDRVVAWSYDEWVKPKPHQDGVKVRRFRASAAVRVKFADFAALGAWVSDVGVLEGIQVQGIEWALTEKRRDAVVAQVRTAAAQDAVTRAQAYADALGLGPVRLLAVYEDGLRPHVSAGAPGPVAFGARAMAADAGGGAFELRPDDIDVHAELTADFEAGTSA
ncbi:protein of unknown function DUF541 [Beutenbergia cavernae DSM 12333]|uniref:SIMPL domain-containing protein n=1 Tax=Beutenbergia cavernae (strain ATCC BAA-8 / DSM 12333 / CCUG 43141 / JCM 11478 / NBRC 16432 / NCIMB 13614 / HKI 0122) TaxID=471853 RepID=C5BX80_BEUC1|nr:SIMPL domain-containing protein [Beutenbergia cavernae]ACQ78755.1 protein of unknown function DUF541 [Beutenbergia cavernae DSM 12333]